MKATEKKTAKLCYEHIGGKLGNLLLEKFVEKGWLAKENLRDKNFYITEKGTKEFSKLGIDLSLIHS
ncbi:ArsR family transcriptional regulator [Pedobacter ureilyticus]|uniref:ArsR family transcriptional regulator n=1 Tax=Pedobacter ureilyticus TaxID=1393051 RepID=A0ABW9J8D3_9SPHI|nr:ArsR family transcriptional regulator [Pedobacter helvus]